MILLKAVSYYKKQVLPMANGLPVIKLLTIATYADIADFIAKQLSEVRHSCTGGNCSKIVVAGHDG